MKISAPLPVPTPVRFNVDWLSRCDDSEIRRFANRTAYIFGYRGQIGAGVPEPIVMFPRHGRFKEIKLFEVPWRQLELVPSTDAVDRVPLAYVLRALKQISLPADAYAISKITAIAPVDAGRALVDLAALGIVRALNEAGDSALAERYVLA